jgi:hypothetical protein
MDTETSLALVVNRTPAFQSVVRVHTELFRLSVDLSVLLISWRLALICVVLTNVIPFLLDIRQTLQDLGAEYEVAKQSVWGHAVGCYKTKDHGFQTPPN